MMCFELFELIGASFIGVMLIMTILWAIAVIKNNTGFVDIGWALSFLWIVLATAYLGDGSLIKRLLLGSLALVWSTRLAFYLISRFNADHEDPRYTKIMEGFGPSNRSFKMYLMFLFQGVLILLLSLPFYIIFGYSNSPFSFIEILALIVIAAGIYGETLSDRQLEVFKQNPDNKGKVCQSGLWRYSRHPNYFFEWVIWIGFFLFALGTPWGWTSIVSPLLMLILLTKVSGIPPSEEQAIASKGDLYREYQKKTSAFIPWV